MACLSREDILRLALGLDGDGIRAKHLDHCPACRAAIEEMQSLVRRLTDGHAAFDRGHDEASERLLTLLPAASRPPEPVTLRDRIMRRIGGLTMRQRVMLGGVGAALAAVLTVLLLWGSSPKPVSAMEKMAAKIREAKSYKATMTSEAKLAGEPGKTAVTVKSTGTVHWLAPRTFRVDFKTGPIPAVNGRAPLEGRHSTQISPAGKPGISINHKAKTFHRLPARQGQVSGLIMLEKLGEFSGQADRELGTREINGSKARGFEIEGQKMDPDCPFGLFEIWVDAQSNLPVLVGLELQPQSPETMSMQDFQWNIDLDPKLFDPTPPEGYTDVTPKPPTLQERQEQVRQITEAFRLYADLSGWQYPRVKMIRPQVVYDQMRKMVVGLAEEQTADWKIDRAVSGFMHVTRILTENPDAAYYGKTVGPSDKDQVLLRWKLDDGNYSVIFGDLREQTVKPEQLRALERK